MEPKTAIILQARMGSTRLPGKVLLPFGKNTLLDWIINRISLLKIDTIVATSDKERDDPIEQYCLENEINFFRGSEANVLARYYQCAYKFNLTNIIRLTSDNPFIDLNGVFDLIRIFRSYNLDYINNFDSLPIGMGSEIFSISSLEKSVLYGKEAHHLEHVNEYILENKQLFNMLTIVSDKKSKIFKVGFSIDTPEDYERIKSYLNSGISFSTDSKEIMQICTHFV